MRVARACSRPELPVGWVACICTAGSISGISGHRFEGRGEQNNPQSSDHPVSQVGYRGQLKLSFSPGQRGSQMGTENSHAQSSSSRE